MSQNDDDRKGKEGTAADPGAGPANDRPANDGPAEAPGAEAGGEAQAEQQAAGEQDGEQDPLAKAEAEIADLKDRLLRAVADAENLRRRMEREMADLRKYAVSDFARDMLGVADNLQRAIDAAGGGEGGEQDGEPAGDLAQLLEGVSLTRKELIHALEKHGVRPVDPQGEKLDPNLHQAVVQVDDPEAEAGTVVHVMQIGYTIHDRLLRPAMVGVAKGRDDSGNAAGQKVDTQA